LQANTANAASRALAGARLFTPGIALPYLKPRSSHIFSRTAGGKPYHLSRAGTRAAAAAHCTRTYQSYARNLLFSK